MQKYIDNPGLLFGKKIIQKDHIVYVGDETVIECDTVNEAKATWAQLSQIKFAAGIGDKNTKYRQAFAYGEGAKATQQHTGWTKTQ